MNLTSRSRLSFFVAGLLVSALSACTSIGYRCPLDESDSPEYPTACAGMQDAMNGAKKGVGGKTSVLMDAQGRLVPRELLESRAVNPLSAAASREPYRQKSGEPVFVQPKVFQTWTSAFVDADGNLHDGRHSWFTTPGRWSYGTVDQPGNITNNLMGPSMPEAKPAGRVVRVDPQTGEPVAAPQGENVAPKATPQTEKARDKAAQQTLSSTAAMASRANIPQAQQQPASYGRLGQPVNSSVTSPAVQLGQ